MSSRTMRRIREAISDDRYDLTRHAVEEMAEDGLLLADVENAILTGEITKIKTDDARGPRFTVVGWSEDQEAEVGVVGRFTETGLWLVVTVYEVSPAPGN